MKQEVLSTMDAFIKRNEDSIFRHIARLVAINSIEEAPQENAPFGPGPKKALDEALAICSELGLGTRNCENKIGYAYIGGDDDRYLATITHVDVVPAGPGWEADPFVMRDREGYILGRGVIDDKGPSVICMYALKFLKEQGIALRYPIRALFGANEETGMKDVEHYLANYPAPLFCFSPDADFPLICGEKGIWHGRMTALADAENILSMSGGVAPNAVPSFCEATVRAKNLQSTDDVTAEPCGEDTWHLTARGISGHASLPQGTKNANGVMIAYLLDNGVASEREKPFLEAALLVHQATDGSKIGIDAVSEGFSPLTVVSGMIGMENGKIWQSLDSRYVPSTSGKEILEKLQAKFSGSAEVICSRDAAPFYKSPECPEIRACMNAYCLVTGEKAEPFTIGGGTYARDFPNAVGFGPEYEGRKRPAFVGSMHGAEEGASKAELLESLKIYILSLLNLEEVDF
ncbi:MAG: Sapep family Mn(2+)-dependent dipeptidase [Oscillospiraceae bacterium]|nr:Sapep family Mn(2+)-dependent dipeptidase [Oscillospiraceae bacterium]